jgi:hypothetical protein
LGNDIVNNNGKINPNQPKRDNKILSNNIQNQAMNNMKNIKNNNVNVNVNGLINGSHTNGKIKNL